MHPTAVESWDRGPAPRGAKYTQRVEDEAGRNPPLVDVIRAYAPEDVDAATALKEVRWIEDYSDPLVAQSRAHFYRSARPGGKGAILTVASAKEGPLEEVIWRESKRSPAGQEEGPTLSLEEGRTAYVQVGRSRVGLVTGYTHDDRGPGVSNVFGPTLKLFASSNDVVIFVGATLRNVEGDDGPAGLHRFVRNRVDYLREIPAGDVAKFPGRVIPGYTFFLLPLSDAAELLKSVQPEHMSIDFIQGFAPVTLTVSGEMKRRQANRYRGLRFQLTGSARRSRVVALHIDGSPLTRPFYNLSARGNETVSLVVPAGQEEHLLRWDGVVDRLGQHQNLQVIHLVSFGEDTEIRRRSGERASGPIRRLIQMMPTWAEYQVAVTGGGRTAKVTQVREGEKAGQEEQFGPRLLVMDEPGDAASDAPAGGTLVASSPGAPVLSAFVDSGAASWVHPTMHTVAQTVDELLVAAASDDNPFSVLSITPNEEGNHSFSFSDNIREVAGTPGRELHLEVPGYDINLRIAREGSTEPFTVPSGVNYSRFGKTLTVTLRMSRREFQKLPQEPVHFEVDGQVITVEFHRAGQEEPELRLRTGRIAHLDVGGSHVELDTEYVVPSPIRDGRGFFGAIITMFAPQMDAVILMLSTLGSINRREGPAELHTFISERVAFLDQERRRRHTDSRGFPAGARAGEKFLFFPLESARRLVQETSPSEMSLHFIQAEAPVTLRVLGILGSDAPTGYQGARFEITGKSGNGRPAALHVNGAPVSETVHELSVGGRAETISLGAAGQEEALVEGMPLSTGDILTDHSGGSVSVRYFPTQDYPPGYEGMVVLETALHPKAKRPVLRLKLNNESVWSITQRTPLEGWKKLEVSEVVSLLPRITTRWRFRETLDRSMIYNVLSVYGESDQIELGYGAGRESVNRVARSSVSFGLVKMASSGKWEYWRPSDAGQEEGIYELPEALGGGVAIDPGILLNTIPNDLPPTEMGKTFYRIESESDTSLSLVDQKRVDRFLLRAYVLSVPRKENPAEPFAKPLAQLKQKLTDRLFLEQLASQITDSMDQLRDRAEARKASRDAASKVIGMSLIDEYPRLGAALAPRVVPLHLTMHQLFRAIVLTAVSGRREDAASMIDRALQAKVVEVTGVKLSPTSVLTDASGQEEGVGPWSAEDVAGILQRAGDLTSVTVHPLSGDPRTLTKQDAQRASRSIAHHVGTFLGPERSELYRVSVNADGRSATVQQVIVRAPVDWYEDKVLDALKQQAVTTGLEEHGVAEVPGGFVVDPAYAPVAEALVLQQGVPFPEGLSHRVPVMVADETTVAGMIGFLSGFAVEGRIDLVFSAEHFDLNDARAATPADERIRGSVLLGTQVDARQLWAALLVSERTGTVYVIAVTEITHPTLHKPLLYVQIQA